MPRGKSAAVPIRPSSRPLPIRAVAACTKRAIMPSSTLLPTPLPAPEYVAHSPTLFAELGLSEALAHDEAFLRLFSGDSSAATGPVIRLAAFILL